MGTWDFLFGKSDTPESLSNEVFGFFDKFRRLQTRIQSLVDVKETEISEEKELHEGKTRTEEERHSQVYARELDRHDDIVIELTEDLSVLAKSMVLAEKVVKFAEET